VIAHRLERLIPDATGIIAVIIMVCAFMLSFANLQAGAVQAGISPWLSWAWPVCIDALLIAGSLMILRSSLRQESTRFGWVVVIVFTVVSVAFNIAHSPDDLTSRAAHAVPPVTLMVSIEMFTLIIRSDLDRGNVRLPVTRSPEPVSSPVHVTPVSDVTSPDGTVPDVTPKRKVTDAEVLQFFEQNPQASYVDAAEVLQVTRQTISRNVTRLVDEGRMARDGKDLVVLPHRSPEVAES